MPRAKSSTATRFRPEVPITSADQGEQFCVAESPLGIGEANAAKRYRPATLAVRGGRIVDRDCGPLIAPIHQSTAYRHATLGHGPAHSYSRVSNPTVSVLEEALGALENAPPGVAFSSGMAAVATVLLALVTKGQKIVFSAPLYGGTERFARELLQSRGNTVHYAKAADNRHLIEVVTKFKAHLLFVETPANPTLQLVDLAAVAEFCQTNNVILIVDNTFLTPLILRPLDWGADITIQSTTKYIDGHNATTGGIVVTRNEEWLERFRYLRKTIGTIQSPFEAWLTLRGLSTLPQRLKQQAQNAAAIARFLERHSAVKRVLHPALDSFPQRELALRQHGRGEDRHGAVVTFELHGGFEAARRFVSRLELIYLAENLGAAETLITHPFTMSHAGMKPDLRDSLGIDESLLRLSVGLEDSHDLVADLTQALDDRGER